MLAPHPLKERASIWNQRNAPQFPILRPSCRVTPHNDLASVEIYVPPSDLPRLTDSAACECQARCQLRAVYGVAAMPRAHLLNQRVELVDGRQRNLFAAYGCSFHDRCRVAVNDASFDGNV